MTVVVTLLAVVVVVLTVLVAGLLRSHAVILRRLHELGAGVEAGGAPQPPPTPPQPLPLATTAHDGRVAADVVGVGPRGEAVAVRVADVDHDTVLVFLSSGCATCQAFWEALGDPGLPDGTRLVAVTRGEEAESPAAVADVAPRGVPVVLSSRAWGDYAVPGAPYVVEVEGRTGRVRGEGTGPGWEQVRRMLLHGAGDARGGRKAARDARRGGKAAADARRERAVDEALRRAGIGAGHPSLYQDTDDLSRGHRR